ncbi:MAG: acyl-[acyl-carrier-protein] thioesterase [Candidatus Limimorpha sp.]
MKNIVIGERFSQNYRVTGANMDSEYRMTVVAILSFFQDTVASYLTTRNIAAFDIADDGYLWVLSDYSLEIVGKMPLWRENIEAVICPSEVSAVKMFFDYYLRNNKGEVFAKGTSRWSIVNVLDGRPVRISEVAAVSGENDVKHPKMVFPPIVNKVMEYKHLTNISDIDFNNHVNNISYIKISLSALPLEIAKSYCLESLSIKFMCQCHINENITCEYDICLDDGRCLCSIVNEQRQEVCRLVMMVKPNAGDISKQHIKDVVNRNEVINY